MDDNDPEQFDKLARMRHKYTRKVIAKHIPLNSRVLDIGIGAGGYWFTLAEKNEENRKTLNASLSEGTVYLFTIIVLIIPFFISTDYYKALLITILISIDKS